MNSKRIDPLTEKEEQALLRGDAMHMKAWVTIQALKNKNKDILLKWVDSIQQAFDTPSEALQCQEEDNTLAKTPSVPSSDGK